MKLYQFLGKASGASLFALALLGTSTLALAAEPRPLGVTDANFMAASRASVVHIHVNPRSGADLRDRQAARGGTADGFQARAPQGAGAAGIAGNRYPADMEYLGGTFLYSVISHAVYFDPAGQCGSIAACWGDPEGFLNDLSTSEYIRVVDPYVRAAGHGRYTVGAAYWSRTPAVTKLGPADINALLHAAAAASGESGYGHAYHVFLAPGVEACDDSGTDCYSPSNPGAWTLCAYHGSVDFPDVGHVVYSLNGYANVGSCRVKPGTPNGSLVDSTNYVLAHELIETITDPDGTAWRTGPNATPFQVGWFSNRLLGNLEIADLCKFEVVVNGAVYSDTASVRMNGKFYALPLQYANDKHACIGYGSGP